MLCSPLHSHPVLRPPPLLQDPRKTKTKPGAQENQDKGAIPGEDELNQVLLTHVKTLQKSLLIYI